MKRIFDVFFAVFGLVLVFPIILCITVAGYFDTGSPFFLQPRMGKRKKTFVLFKFRTMAVGTHSVASHQVDSASVTRLGSLLRKSKLDELPQLVNVLKGDMSLVGPRPNLENQDELIKERERCGVYEVLPGITGLAQVNNIDMSTPVLLAEIDRKMIDSLNLLNYFKYIIMTVTGSGSGDAVGK